jgi:MFS family permease
MGNAEKEVTVKKPGLPLTLAGDVQFAVPIFMVVFPRSRYGQFCSANAMLRSLAGIAGGVAAGAFFDYAAHFVKHEAVYRLMPLWQMLFTIPALVCVLLLYQSWRSYGGDLSYVPPAPGEARVPAHLGEAAEAAVPDISL